MKIRQEPRNKKKLLLIIGALIAAIGIVVGGVAIAAVGFYNDVRNEGIEWENRLSEQYQRNQNRLSTFTLKFNDTLGLADRESEKISGVLVDAISGRYDDSDLLSSGENNPLFAAVQEAYPDTSGVSEAYRLVQEEALSGREEYAQEQEKLNNMVSGYLVWRDSGLLKSQVIRLADFPSDRLEARIGDTVYYGNEALEKMRQLVQTQDTLDTYESGIIESLMDPED